MFNCFNRCFSEYADNTLISNFASNLIIRYCAIVTRGNILPLSDNQFEQFIDFFKYGHVQTEMFLKMFVQASNELDSECDDSRSTLMLIFKELEKLLKRIKYTFENDAVHLLYIYQFLLSIPESREKFIADKSFLPSYLNGWRIETDSKLGILFRVSPLPDSKSLIADSMIKKCFIGTELSQDILLDGQKKLELFLDDTIYIIMCI